MKVSDLVEKYIAIRARKAELKGEYDNKVAGLDDALSKIEAALLNTFNTTGIENIKTSAGTAYVATRTSCTVADRDAFLRDWVVPNGAWEFLENRVSKTAVEQYRSEHGVIPPGLNWSEMRVINVRKS